MYRSLLIGLLAAALPMAAVAEDEAGSTTEKREGAPAASAAPSAAPEHHHEHGPGHAHGDGHGHEHAAPSADPNGGTAGSGGGMAGSGGERQQLPAAPTRPGPEGKLTVDVGELTFDMPSSWKSESPASQMRKAQLRIPHAEADKEDGEVAISFFPGGGGGVEPNINRWYGQMETADGKPVDDKVAKRDTFKAGDLEVVLINIPGTLKASGMPGMGPAEDKKGWRMVAGIVSVKEGPWFFKGTGPDKTMSAAYDQFKTMLTSVKAK